MRGFVEVVWLEDKLDRSHSRRRDIVKAAIEKKGYRTNILEINSLDDALKIISQQNKRVDFFISDYNLGDNETGLEFLVRIRTMNMYKQFFVLYSNNDYDQIRTEVINKLSKTKIELFSNFTFISLSTNPHLIEQDFQTAVNLSLSRWDELNAMRGLYMCEHAELEFELRHKLNEHNENVTYKNLFHKLKNQTVQTYKMMHKQVFNDWEDLIELRNLLAHTKEGYDEQNGFFIQSQVSETVKIFEKDLDSERERLSVLKAKILFLIQNPNRPMTAQLANRG